MKAIAIAAMGLGLTACATASRGTTEPWQVNTSPPGASVQTSNGRYCSPTPCAIKMPRKAEFTATVTLDGYQPETVFVTHDLSGKGAAAYAGNILMGGVIGLTVDAFSGSTQDLKPNPVTLTLKPLAGASSNGGGQ